MVPGPWFARRPSAWSAWRNVVVSRDLLEQPPNRYLLAHELGHLANRHHARCLATTVWVVGLGILLATLGPAWPVAARATGLILFLCGVGHMIGLCSLRSEYGRTVSQLNSSARRRPSKASRSMREKSTAYCSAAPSCASRRWPSAARKRRRSASIPSRT